MTSLLTNASAITALQNLTSTNKTMQTTQDRISTGMRVSTAADNAAYWSIATTMRSDKAAISTVSDALGLASATIDVASSAIDSAGKVVSQIKEKLVAARQVGVDRTKVQAEIKQLQDQIKSVADSSVFSGQNWLSVDSSATGYNPTRSVVASFIRSGGSVSIGTIDVDLSTTALYDASATGEGIVDKSRTVSGTTASVSTLDISTLTDSVADTTTLNNYISVVEASLTELTTAGANLGAAKNRVGLQSDFVGDLIDSLTMGIGKLVDADMNQESTKLQALQVQQQLGIQSLSIANQSSQQILALFKG
ncbi:MAG: flaC [Hyphomicrobiales bacterium]|jgi:flagellin|nr:flaC [Hyphomicrobiales bacterium]